MCQNSIQMLFKLKIDNVNKKQQNNLNYNINDSKPSLFQLIKDTKTSVEN